MTKIQRSLGVFALAMINVAAIGTVKNWPTIAEYGLSSIVYLILAALIFFIPTALVSAELATGWSKEGGVFLWVKEAFGHKAGFLAIWLQWVNNVVWYPTSLSFIAATIAYIFDPELASNNYYMISLILIIFWLVTLVNLLGMRTSSFISSFGVVFGTFIPATVIIFLGCLWYFTGKPIQIAFTANDLIPKFNDVNQIVFFTGIILSLCGMEMSAVHARDVRDPQKDYPKAILLSGLLIFVLTILAVLTIAIAIPQKQINLAGGTLQAFSFFLTAYNLKWVIPVIATLIAISAIGSLSTWTVGPLKGLLAAAKDGDLPPSLRKINKHGMPITLMLFQAILVSILSFVFLLMPTVSSAFWILSALVAEIYLVMYLLMFAASIKLRYTKPDVKRSYKIPGGKYGIWIVSGIGILSSLFAIIIGFFPPAQLATGNEKIYVSFLLIGLAIFCLGPSIILLFQKPSWKKRLTHE